MMISEEEKSILQMVYELKHATRRQLYRRFCANADIKPISKRHFNRKIARLIALSLLSDKESRTNRLFLVNMEAGNRSERYLHLLLAGARTIGLAKLGSHHYRQERREFARHRTASQELSFLAQKNGWQLYSDNVQARAVLRAFMHQVMQFRQQTTIPEHMVDVPMKISPDKVLVTQKETFLCLIAHPHSSLAFWKTRMVRYQRMLRQDTKAIAIPLHPSQKQECEQVVEEFALSRRVLVLAVEELDEIERRFGA